MRRTRRIHNLMMAKTANKTKSVCSSGVRRTNSNAGPRKRTGIGKSSAAAHPKWKLVSKPSKSFVLHLFDAAIRLLMHKIPENVYEEVHSALVESRNQVAVKLETLKVPPTKQDYNSLSTTLVKLREMNKRLERRLSCTNTALDSQTSELENLEEEKVQLQDFGKVPTKHHPLLLEPMDKELFLNFNSIK